MKFIVSILLFITFIFFTSCSVKRQDGEKIKLRVFVTKGGKSDKYCFDDIRGVSRENLSSICSEGSKPIELPLNIGADSSMFLFSKDNKKDTLIITYINTVEQIGDNYTNGYANLQIKKSSFKNIISSCLKSKDDTTYCDDQSFFIYLIY